jgi:hypothetical protein
MCSSATGTSSFNYNIQFNLKEGKPISFNLPVNANLGAFVLVDGELVDATYATTNDFNFIR